MLLYVLFVYCYVSCYVLLFWQLVPKDGVIFATDHVWSEWSVREKNSIEWINEQTG